ncbi:hypothetical protein [Psychrosphaera aestuarii]|uniref:hypothetical protein n=1 Tax=Psychrosphaera aestuarii TaxID=1266052 RepID=UPI001B326F73|nr:hypothetical protein [Psychrosphaera aestuarii]
MSYLDTLGELVLIASLLMFIISINKTSKFDSPFRNYLTIALLFIVVTASFGAARFAGVEQLISIHDLLSLISAKLAMVVYVFSLPVVMLSQVLNRNYKDLEELSINFSISPFKVIKLAKSAMVAILAFNVLAIIFDIQAANLLSDVAVILGFLLFSLITKEKALVYGAIVALVLVPASTQLHISSDLSMAVFHLLLALHFWLINKVFVNFTKGQVFAQVS